MIMTEHENKTTVSFCCSYSVASKVKKNVRLLACEILNLAALSMADGDLDPVVHLAMKGRKPRRSKFTPKPKQKDKILSLRLRVKTAKEITNFTKRRTGIKTSDVMRGAILVALEES